MTTEEAIKILETGSTMPDCPHTIADLDEACRMAIAALHAQTDFNGTYVNIEWLRQVEAERDALKAKLAPAKLDRSLWKGCELCKDAERVGGLSKAYQKDRGGWSVEANLREYKYCPICGKPLTKKAWAELKRRIGGNDGKID